MPTIPRPTRADNLVATATMFLGRAALEDPMAAKVLPITERPLMG